VAVSDRRRYRLRQAGELVRRLGRPSPPPDPPTLAEQSALLSSLRKLPTKQAAALILRHYHGYTNREIAASLGVPDATIASRLAKGRKRLQAAMAYSRQEKMVDPA
jgi:RNA polymerase sigma factor (sigma-70 family)